MFESQISGGSAVGGMPAPGLLPSPQEKLPGFV
eukprot:SAG11_NODE_2838_length_2917_cov_5.779178_1_plen_32_part_10